LLAEFINNHIRFEERELFYAEANAYTGAIG
jgi:hypothetical protein